MFLLDIGNIGVRGTVGDHKGPPSRSSLPSPLREVDSVEMMESHRIFDDLIESLV